MLLEDHIKHQYKANTCYMVIWLDKAKHNVKSVVGRHVDNYRNCDIFIDDYNFYFYADVKLYRFHSKRCFDIKQLKSLIIQFDTKELCYKLELRCLPPEAVHPAQPKTARKEYIQQIAHFAKAGPTGELREHEPKIELWKLKRITDVCRLKLDSAETEYKFESNYAYGFARKYAGRIESDEELDKTVRVSQPSLVSPLQRSIERIKEEIKRFSRDQYELNFFELQVPEGIDNPINYKMKLNDTALTQEQANLLHNLTCKPEFKQLPSFYDQNELNCGLVSILLAICYDVRCTENEPTCESGWTRSILAPALSYFEVFTNYKAVIISFMRRVLIYPLFRNYELARLCVLDAINVLEAGSAWICKQLLITHQQFSANGDSNRDVFNKYFLDDYIRYVMNEDICTKEQFFVMSRNLKNVSLDITKRHLDLGINEIETRLLKEIINEMRLEAAEVDGDDDEDDDDDDEDEGEDDDEDDADDEEADDDDEDDDDDDFDDVDDFIEEDDVDDDGNASDINNEIISGHILDVQSEINSLQNSQNYFDGFDVQYGSDAYVSTDDIFAQLNNELVANTGGIQDGNRHSSSSSSTSSQTEGNSVIEQCSSSSAAVEPTNTNNKQP